MRTGKEDTFFLYEPTMCCPRMVRVAASVCRRATPTLLKTWSISSTREEKKGDERGRRTTTKRTSTEADVRETYICHGFSCEATTKAGETHGKKLQVSACDGETTIIQEEGTYFSSCFRCTSKGSCTMKMLVRLSAIYQQTSPSCVCPLSPKCISMTSNTPSITSRCR